LSNSALSRASAVLRVSSFSTSASAFEASTISRVKVTMPVSLCGVSGPVA
jgi:hypothetical protein